MVLIFLVTLLPLTKKSGAPSTVFNSKLKLDIKPSTLDNFVDKFKFRRGRINCSLNDNDGWRWLGIQFSIEN